MSFIDLQGRFLKVSNPAQQSLWMRFRLALACFIYPAWKKRHDDWAANYFSSQYMLAVHKHYENELRKLNKAVAKKDSKLKELQKTLRDKEQ